MWLSTDAQIPCCTMISCTKVTDSQSRWPHGQGRGSAAFRFLGLRVRIPPWAWKSVSCGWCIFCRVEVSPGESNGKLPPRTCPGCSVPEPYRSHDWALVPASPASKGWILMNEWMRGLSVGLSTRPEESYHMWCVWVWSWSLDNEETLDHWGAVVP